MRHCALELGDLLTHSVRLFYVGHVTSPLNKDHPAFRYEEVEPESDSDGEPDDDGHGPDAPDGIAPRKNVDIWVLKLDDIWAHQIDGNAWATYGAGSTLMLRGHLTFAEPNRHKVVLRCAFMLLPLSSANHMSEYFDICILWSIFKLTLGIIFASIILYLWPSCALSHPLFPFFRRLRELHRRFPAFSGTPVASTTSTRSLPRGKERQLSFVALPNPSRM